MRSFLVAAAYISLCSSALAQAARPSPLVAFAARPSYGVPRGGTYVPPAGHYGRSQYGYGPYGGPPPPPVDPTAHRHDGFYLRMGIGLGYGWATTKTTVSGSELKATYSGTGPAFELLLGGTVARGFVVGGGLLELDILNPTIEVQSSDLTMSSVFILSAGSTFSGLGFNTVGPFFDWFPDETGGAHIGGMFGLGVIHLEGNLGFGGSLWGGYDFWVAKQWSLGAELRGTLASGSRDYFLRSQAVEFHDTGGTVELLFTALLH